uniref:Uncharacterized protein LOC117365534 n=1 Tax=Geotrypetes seraphini TaxID=260995 RepID=A0A6P8S2L5_GEOSA|nr:uncharacterized protein LOC117365534 [Geotrypetes seraphini]
MLKEPPPLQEPADVEMLSPEAEEGNQEPEDMDWSALPEFALPEEMEVLWCSQYKLCVRNCEAVSERKRGTFPKAGDPDPFQFQGHPRSARLHQTQQVRAIQQAASHRLQAQRTRKTQSTLWQQAQGEVGEEEAIEKGAIATISNYLITQELPLIRWDQITLTLQDESPEPELRFNDLTSEKGRDRRKRKQRRRRAHRRAGTAEEEAAGQRGKIYTHSGKGLEKHMDNSNLQSAAKSTSDEPHWNKVFLSPGRNLFSPHIPAPEVAVSTSENQLLMCTEILYNFCQLRSFECLKCMLFAFNIYSMQAK